MKTFETERLFLTPTTTEDAEFILVLFNSPKWIEFIGDRNLKTSEDAAAYISNKMTPQIERLGFGNYTVTRKFDGAKIGGCGLYDRDGFEGFDIGFAFLPQYEKKGYGFESANVLKELAFSEFNLTEISGITSVKNIASQKLLIKLGLHFEKKIKLTQGTQEVLLYKLVF
ncbi:GNAT family N-acetyltransferase [Flavobacterium sp. ACAM 123]|uniref:GNAT family N-acetyltransferase n=1 Tax=Flavobacterium sp. ACAM 123 TaxID=1189620 RepID=UPI00030885F5|nr:GNAT family N-acetyltransferase [Flavobacterium sp. ACAM 123]